MRKKRKTVSRAPKSRSMSRPEIEELVSSTVKQTLAEIGLHIKSEEDIEQLRRDWQYLRAWRESIQKGSKVGWYTFITVAVTGFLSMLFLGAQAMFHRGGA